MKKSTLIISITFWEVFVIITLLCWWTVVPLNINLTQEFLKPKINIPYYEDNLPWGLANIAFTNQFGVYWVGFFFDFLRIINIFTVVLTLAYLERINPELLILGMIIINAILFSFEVIKAILRGWQLWFCVNFQICRNWDPNNCQQKFDCPPNYAFWWSFVYSVFWIFVILVTLIALVTFLVYADKQERLRKATIRKNIRESGMVIKNRIITSEINEYFNRN